MDKVYIITSTDVFDRTNSNLWRTAFTRREDAEKAILDLHPDAVRTNLNWFDYTDDRDTIWIAYIHELTLE